TYARRERMAGYAADGYRGCIGRTLDRISIFPDGRAYVCSFLFDTDLHFANMIDGKIVINKEDNEFDLFTRVLTQASCGGCKIPGTCLGGCPAEELVLGSASCAAARRSCSANVRTPASPTAAGTCPAATPKTTNLPPTR
ncbi:MAG: SPASM domain-containing protein, partial [Pseudonocardiaceae bacterium]